MKKTSINWLKVRIFFVFFLLFISFLLILLRVVQLQVVEKERLQELAGRQHQSIITLAPSRGTIFDRNGRVLAKSTEIESLYAHPRQIENPSKVAGTIARVLGARKRTIEKKLKSPGSFVWLERKIPPEKAEKIRSLKIRGLGFLKEHRRYYPNLDLAANLIGFVGIDSQGLEGLERQYDRHLRGDPHRVLLEHDAKGGEIITKPTPPPSELSSNSLVLTIDLDIQYVAKKVLSQAVKETSARSGIVVVMDPRNAQILAMANQPTFNPNSYQNYPARTRRNRAVTDLFEPGSIFKVFLLAAALEEKVVKWNDIFFCHNGTYRIGKRAIHDHKEYGWLTLQKVIKFSSNIGASQIGFRVGAKKLYQYIRKFGFGARTSIDLPGEVKGLVRDPKTLSEIGIANSSFGQGISVTAIQLAMALSAIANGGDLMRPYVVERIIDSDGRVVKSFDPKKIGRVISRETSREVVRIMKQVVEPDGTGARAALSGYAVAGKTGTAQKIDHHLKTYTNDRYVSSFMGFVPADSPRLVIVVILDEPKGTPYGGIVAAPVFRTIAERALSRLNIPPSRGVVAQNEKSRAQSGPPVQKETASKGPVGPQAGEALPRGSGVRMRALLKWLGIRLGW